MENVVVQNDGSRLEAEPVEIPVEMGLEIRHGDTVLEIVDLCPETRRERIAVARKILRYNRTVRQQCKETGVAFGDKDTPYHFWDVNWKAVLGG